MASGDTLVVWRPGDNEPPASNYAQIVIRNGHLVLAFDTTTAESAVFSAIWLMSSTNLKVFEPGGTSSNATG